MSAPCCGSRAGCAASPPRSARGRIDTPAGAVPVVRTAWSWRDRIDHLRCRLGGFRDRYAVAPGLYAVGSPGPASDVLVTASYGLSFDHVRRALAGRHAWILVLDTKGVNVWCAAGKGTFGTDELVRRIGVVRLGDVVAHRHLVVPQLGAPGVAAHEVQHATGFRVHYGPVRSADLPAYLDAGRRATDEMRRVRFSSTDRAVVIPMEIRPALKPLAMYAVLVLLASAPGAGGPSLARAWAEGLPLVGVGLVAILAGAVLTPLLLPVIPGRAFSVKGALVGALATAVYVAAVPAMARSVTSLAFAAIFGPAASSFLAFQFTGATTFTGISGVRKELRRSLPVHVGALLASAALLVARGIAEWR